uniref:Uncharacterized protein, isoform A n=1 Tax=Drosophila melanogaster TaxID=7227 RepID=M9MRN4_DROME|nr:uncharacterized protein Dmel_CG42692, isoform A [Drosophila melanogaster]ADV37053.1 uncharacterized protein Dmel_CG42692, isoform A [Drosophila melanogaster]|eukprot:NP_001188803.1 uncharacterized protein Dmel_CG42692, isoform A [Drosophila melanogaster]
MNKEATKRRRQRCTESLKDILSNLRIRNRKAWFNYVDKTKSPHIRNLLAKESYKKLKNASKTSELQKQVIYLKNIWVSLAHVLALLFDQGPIEQISSLVFTIFTITKSLVVGIKYKTKMEDFAEHHSE